MAEEFQESDILFSDQNRRRYSDQERNSFFISETIISQGKYNSWAVHSLKNHNKNRKKKTKMENSLPLKIPESIYQYGGDDEQEGDELEPPHVIVDRRIAGKIAFSVCTGNGRTLKGRELSQVRNSILRMTGFLET